jgi:hypothetical protein
MLQCVRDWVQGLGSRQHMVISRLSKQSVRNHENIRQQGEGGQAAAEGTAAWNAGHQAQHDIQGYINQQIGQIPGISQAQNLFGQFSPPAGPPGMRRDITTGGGERPEFPSMSSAPPAIPTSGFPGASSGYDSSSTYPGQGYQPPGGPPPLSTSSYTPSYNSGYGEPPGHHHSYGESQSPYGEPRSSYPSFPGVGMSMPDAGGFGGPGGYAPPPGPPGAGGFDGYVSPPGPPPGSFPSPFGPPQGAPPGFPDASNQHANQRSYRGSDW